MRIRKEKRDGCHIFHLDGTIDSSTADQAHKELEEALGDGAGRYVLDFSSLLFISSAGLRVLLLLAKKVKGAQGSLVLCALPDHVRDVFEIAGFSLIFDIKATLVQATAPEQPPPEQRKNQRKVQSPD